MKTYAKSTPPDSLRAPCTPELSVGLAQVLKATLAQGGCIYLDAHAAKALSAGNAIVIQGCPGLRLEAVASAKSWVYRYKSLVDGRMRQVRFGTWPSTCFTDASRPLQRM